MVELIAVSPIEAYNSRTNTELGPAQMEKGMNGRTLIGVLVAGFVVFMWGFAFWGATTLPYQVWDSVPNDPQAQATLAKLFPESGYYSVPSVANNSPEEQMALLDSGVWATVNIDHTPPQPGELGNMLFGLGHCMLVMLLLSLVLVHLGSKGIRTAFLVGLTATVFSNLGDVIWWNFPLDWKLTIMLYDMGFWIIGGLVLGFFIRDKALDEAPSAGVNSAS